MRSLKFLTKRAVSEAWKYHQLKSIDALVCQLFSQPSPSEVPSVEPLFPGSYLCNQIAFLDSNAAVTELDEYLVDAPLDVIYESLSCSTQASHGSYLLIDGCHLDEVTRPLLLDVVRRHMDGIDTILLLDRRALGEMTKLFESLSLKVHGAKPEWSNAADILSFYRNAHHCVFINNHRAMDAAVCDCSVTLISDSEFAMKQSTSALWYSLNGRSNCQLIGALSATFGRSAVTIVENRVSSFQQLLQSEPVVKDADWLDEYRTTATNSKAIVERYISAWHRPSQDLLDLRLSIRRKVLKLTEDPKRFCSDSRNPVLKKLARLIPSREAA